MILKTGSRFSVLTLILLLKDASKCLILQNARTAILPPKDRIIGGHDADIADYPYMLYVTYQDLFHCGASMIDAKWAMTAAQCTRYFQPSDLQIRANSNALNEGISVAVSRIINHPNFTFDTFDSDISLLELASPLICENCKPIPLGRTLPKVEEIATITGWGLTNRINFTLPDFLQVANIPVSDHGLCQDAYSNDFVVYVTDNMICTDGHMKNDTKAACNGDSGSPMVVNGNQVGIVSWMAACGPTGTPDVYTAVPRFISWIENNTGIIVE